METLTRPRRNKLRGAGDIEDRVVEWLQRKVSYHDIKEKLEKFYGFSIAVRTIHEYKTSFLEDAENQAVQAILKKISKSVQLDQRIIDKNIMDISGYIEKLADDNEYYEKCVRRLMKMLPDEDAEVVQKQTDPEGEETPTNSLPSNELVIMNEIKSYKRLIKENLKEIGLKVDGEDGLVMKYTRMKASVIDLYFALIHNHLPKDKKNSIRDEFRLKLNRL